MNGLWGSGQMSFAKMLLLIDDEELLKNPIRLMETVLERIDFNSDIVITTGVLDVLDHSADKPLYGGKMGIDATERIAGEVERAEPFMAKRMGNDELIERVMGLEENVQSYNFV